MADFDWLNLMRRWNERLLASSWADEVLPEVRTAKWLGFPAATDAQIVAAELRLGISLPPSYRAFLKVSNGWRRLTHSIDHVWGTEEIRWFKKDHKEWIGAYTRPSPYGLRQEVPDDEYFSYENSADFRPAHLNEALQISKVGDAAVFLLNPQAITQDGEWEAWFFANWIPGVHRYRSFQELIEQEYHAFFNIEWKQLVGLVGELPSEFIGAPGSPKRHLKKRRRRQSVKVLNKPLDQWDFDELLAFLSHEEGIVREEAAHGLRLLKNPRAIEPLLALVGEENNLCSTAIYAIKEMAPERILEPALDILRKRSVFGWMSAAMVLGELGDLRAVPIIVEIVKDISPDNFREGSIAGKFLAGFGRAGVDAIIELLAVGEPTVRSRAASSLSYCKEPRVVDIFRRLVNDVDPAIVEIAELALKVLNAPQA